MTLTTKGKLEMLRKMDHIQAVVAPRTLKPLDAEPIMQSVIKTG